MARLAALLLGLLFLLSAVAKLLATDSFEVYIFSFGFFSLNLSYLLARFCIVVEFVLGGALLTMLVCSLLPRRRITIARQWKIVAVSTLLLLLLFSLFLGYVALVGRTDSCQCMGQWVELTPSQSLLKNALLVCLSLLMYFGMPVPPKTIDAEMSESRHSKHQFRWEGIVVAVAVVAVIVSVFCISMPDNWLFPSSQEPYGREVLEETIAKVDDGCCHQSEHRLVAFLTQGCPYCQLAKEKLDAIRHRHRLDSARFLMLYPETIGMQPFLQITYGNRPLVLLLEGDSVVSTYHFRNIDEREIAEWLR